MAEVIPADAAVCTNSHSAGFTSSAMAELLKNSPVIKAVATVSMFFIFYILSIRDLSITRGFPIAWIFGILASCRNLS